MYVCYVDESGTPDVPGNTSHFVLAGLAIPIIQWKTFDESVSKILKQYGLEDAEFHTAWILRAYREQSTIPNFEKMDRVARRAAVVQERTRELLRLQKGKSKNYQTVKKFYKHTQGYIHLSLDERKALVAAVATCIGSWREARLFAECIDKIHFDPVLNKTTVGEQAFEQVVSRFEQFLVKGAPGNNNHGILVHDNNETVAKKHTALMRRFHHNGTLWTDIKRIIDTPLFVNSSLTSMVQMADLCAYALRRYFENGETELFKKIFGRAHRVDNKVVGVRHYSTKCKCIACAAHRGPPPIAAKLRKARKSSSGRSGSK
jgi:hypothetical protein